MFHALAGLFLRPAWLGNEPVRYCETINYVEVNQSKRKLCKWSFSLTEDAIWAPAHTIGVFTAAKQGNDLLALFNCLDRIQEFVAAMDINASDLEDRWAQRGDRKVEISTGVVRWVWL